MLIEAALLPRTLSSVSVRTFVIPFYYGSGSAKAKSYGSCGPGPGSGSATLCNTLCFVFFVSCFFFFSCLHLVSFFIVAIKLQNHIFYRKPQDHLIFLSLFSRPGAAACLLGWHERGGAPHSWLAQAQDDSQFCLRIGRLRPQVQASYFLDN